MRVLLAEDGAHDSKTETRPALTLQQAHLEMSSTRRDAARGLGLWAEDFVAREIRARGRSVLGRRVRVLARGRQVGEFDLIYLEPIPPNLLDGSGWVSLVLVEVRARSSRSCGGAELSVDHRKLHRLRAAAGIFLNSLSLGERSRIREMRIDVWVWDATMGWREIQGVDC